MSKPFYKTPSPIYPDISGMIFDGYYNSFQAMQQNAREEKIKESRLKELQAQEEKKLEIWAKRQLRIEQQIDTKQSPLQRARRLLNKRKEEINRIHSSITNGTDEHKTCEKRLSRRLNSCHSERRLDASSLEETDLVLPEINVKLSKSSSSSSLPITPVKKQTIATPSRSNSLPLLLTTSPSCKSRKLSLPPIDLPIKTCHKEKQLKNQKLPPLKPNFWV